MRLAALFLLFQSGAPERDLPAFDFPQIVERALAHNPWIAAKAARLRSLEHTARQKSDESNWRGWDLGLDAEHYPSGGGSASLAGYDSRVSIGLTVPLFGSQTERQLRLQEVQAERAILEGEVAETTKLVLDGLLGHYQTYSRGMVFEPALEEIAVRLQAKRRILRARVVSGDSLLAEELEAERDLARLALRIEQNREAMRLALEGIRAGVGDAFFPAFFPEPLSRFDGTRAALESVESMTERAVHDHPMILGLGRKIQLLREQERQAAGAYPRSALTLGYATQFGGASGSESGPTLALSFSLPLGASRILHERRRAIGADRDRYEADLHRRRQELGSEIRMRYQELLVATERARLADAQWALAREKERVAALRVTELPEEEGESHLLGAVDSTIARIEASLQKDAAESDLAGGHLRILFSLRAPFGEPAPEDTRSRISAPLDLWVWDASLVEDRGERGRFFDLAKELGVSGIYLGLDARQSRRFWNEEAAPLREFLAACREQGIRVECLLAENGWVLPENRADFDALIGSFLRFQEISPRNARYDALHLDIEPHSLPEWGQGPDSQAAVVRSYLDLLESCRRKGLVLHADLPSWYEKIPAASSNLLRAVLERVDGIVVMNYRTETERFQREAETELSEAVELGKTVRIGVSAESILPESQAFRDWRSMSAMLWASEDRFRAYESFRGFAVQSFAELRRILPISRTVIEKQGDLR